MLHVICHQEPVALLPDIYTVQWLGHTLLGYIKDISGHSSGHSNHWDKGLHSLALTIPEDIYTFHSSTIYEFDTSRVKNYFPIAVLHASVIEDVTSNNIQYKLTQKYTFSNLYISIPKITQNL